MQPCIPGLFGARNLARVIEPTAFVGSVVGYSVSGPVCLPLLCRNSCRNSRPNSAAPWTLANKSCLTLSPRLTVIMCGKELLSRARYKKGAPAFHTAVPKFLPEFLPEFRRSLDAGKKKGAVPRCAGPHGTVAVRTAGPLDIVFPLSFCTLAESASCTC